MPARKANPATALAPMAPAPGTAVAFSELQAMAKCVADSGLFGVKEPNQALALMLISQANGEHPARACQQFSIIQGKACLTSQAMLAKFQAAGGRVQWIERTDAAAEAEFSHPAGGTLRVRWTVEQARRIGLAGKDNWKNYPRQMLSARVISEGVRAILPGVILGFYAPEEIGDIPAAEVVSISPAKPLLATPAPSGESEARPENTHPTEAGEPSPENTAERLAMVERLIGADGEAANEVLRAKGWLEPGQTWRDLPAERLAYILANPARFVKAMAALKEGAQ